ncbi:hypothetical protein [Paraclostridium dentum]|uniref:hypothetical protein n=1 Tax=Paraclostridium dentum TaxID=2662455 RepID=UPI003F307079
MTGTNRNPLSTQESLLGELLDIRQDGSASLTDKFKSFFTKFNDPDWARNVLKTNKKIATSDIPVEDQIMQMASEAILSGESIEDVQARVASDILKSHKEMSNMLNSFTAMHQIDKETVTALRTSGLIQDTHSMKILNALDNNDLRPEELLNIISKKDGDEFNLQKLYNKDLENIINKGMISTDHILNMQNISQMASRGLLGKESTNVMGIDDIIRREAIKEVMLRESSIGVSSVGKTTEYNADSIIKLETILNQTNLSAEQQKNLRYTTN